MFPGSQFTHNEAARVLRLALGMAAADQGCAMPWADRMRLVRLIDSDAPLTLDDWQRWETVVRPWFQQTRPTLALRVEEAAALWRQEEALCPTRP